MIAGATALYLLYLPAPGEYNSGGGGRNSFKGAAMLKINSLIAGGSACLGALLEEMLNFFQKEEREEVDERRSGQMSATTVKRIVSS